MPWLLNAVYLLALLLLSPWLLWRALRTGRYRKGLEDKLRGLRGSFPPGAVWFHGVSVGEVHLLRQLIAAFRRRNPDRACVVSASTDTGLDEARKCFPDLAVFAFPFDFSWAVRRSLLAVAPSLVVLAEGEIWPNFLLACRKLGVPVAVVNGRMSPRSRRRYGRLAWIARPLFRSLDLLAVQTQEYAAAVRALGAPPERVHVTGNVKYDGVSTDRANPRTGELRRLLSVGPDDLVWIAGSTQAPEEEIVVGIYQRLRADFPGLRLFLVPRQKDRFDEVARLLERSGLAFARRSAGTGLGASVVLVDTIGELGALWGLADVAFVGGSLDGRRGGQNMIEPAACGAAVVFGPHVWNFADAATRLLEAGGACQVHDGAGLEGVVRRLLGDREERQRRGTAARDFVLSQQGATERTVVLLEDLLHRRWRGRETMPQQGAA
jgi:3-deoxy-D-manno-octulosonic-acid transferase